MNRIPKLSRSAEIKALLEADIESGQLAPGVMLDERTLAARFNVSRTPVREALQQLAAQRYVRIVPRQGVFVSRMSVLQLRDMLELLSELEAASARLAARRMSHQQREALQQIIAQSQVAHERDDAHGFAAANEAFHDVVSEACHNMYLAEQVRSIRRLISRYRPRPFLAAGRREKTIAEHQRVTQALFSGDEAAAGACMAAHSPGGDAAFSEFLATLPHEYFSDAGTDSPPAPGEDASPEASADAGKRS